MDENGPHRFIGSGTIGRCGLFRVDVALLEEGSLFGWAEVSEAQARPSGSLALLLSIESDVELSATSPGLCLPE